VRQCSMWRGRLFLLSGFLITSQEDNHNLETELSRVVPCAEKAGFIIAEIGQSSCVPGTVNQITIRVKSNLVMTIDTFVTMTGLTGSSTESVGILDMYRLL
jgi:hypothetical protein